MEEGRRSGEHSGIVVKNRSSSGCLIVKKKGDGAGSSSGSRKVFESKKEKKRSRMVLSESGSSDELLMPPHTRVGPETIRVCNGLTVYDKGIREESEIDRKRNRAEHLRHNEDDIFGRNGEHSKRNKLDVFEFDEYDGIDGEMMTRRKHFDEGGDNVGRRRLLGAMPVARSGMVREYESGSSRDVIPEKRKDSYIDRSGSLSRGNRGYKNRFEMSRDETRLPISLLREKYMGDSEEPIRLQGKNGVLKVMVNKKKKMSGSPRSFDYLEAKESQSASKVQETVRMNIPVRSAFYSETEVLEKPAHVVRTKKNETSLPKSPPTKNSKGCNQDLEDSDSSLPPEPKDVEEPIKRSSCKGDKTPAVQLAPAGIKEGKVKRGCGTEKQRLRERIRGMLLDAGWTIDYRPRRNRDYLDAVYINPTGTAYWSIIKAYDALQKQLNDEEEEAKPSRDASAFTPISDEVLSQLTRKTRKRIEKEMKKKQRDDSDSEVEKEAPARKSSNTRNEEESMDSGSHEEKLSSFIKQGGKSLKNRTNENGMNSGNSRGQSSLHASIERPSSGSNSRVLHGRKSKKLGRCTLLVRSSNEGKNSETGGFVPYSGKRTLLSWLIDSGTVKLSQKVQYMNRRRTRVMLEGWVTRDGIHCGCCSKILTVSKFEIHAGSKLRQPFQNIYLDSGVSLLQCQMDAWNRQEESKPFGFHSVHIDGDDPNDDTCGICGDGGDLICCDGCPSTFHQSCLDIQMLPPGDWHCPNCTCKFCGIAGRDITQVEDATICALLTCSMCEKKYHNSCIQEMDVLPTDSIGSVPSLCGQKCRELFDHLQKYIGTKHELEAGFSWSLIHRIDSDSELSSRGLPQRVESNSKLAVALAVMDECFLPIADRRSGINLIRNVLYNCGSNFNRLNYSGFYTAILERGDEIISAASIRFHGTQLAEMPFIGTRHIYRRQGMCRRLFGAIESALCSLKVEKLVIPAIAEFMDAWTTVFGFKPLEDSLKKETRSMNMLVFPGIDMLQKRLLEQENFNGDIATTTGAKQMQQKADIPHVASSDVGSLAEHEHQECDNGGLGPTIEGNGEVAGIESDSPRLGVSLDKTTVMSGSLDASEELQIPTSAEGTVCADSQPVKGIAKSNDRRCQFVSETNQNAMEMETEPRVDSPVEDNTESHKEADRGDARVIEVNVVASHKVEIPLSVEATSSMDSQSGLELAKFSSDGKCLVSSCKVQSILEVTNKTALSSRAEDDSQSCKEGMDVDVAADVDLAVDVKVATSLETQVLAEGTICSDFHSTSKLAESAFASDEDIENKSLLDSPVVDNTNTCKQRDMHDAFAIGADVATSYEAQVSTDGTLCSNSQPQEELAESASDKQCRSVSNMSCIALEAETKAVLSSPDEDIALPSKGHTGDGNAVNSNIVGSSEPTTPVSLEVRVDADPQLGDKLVESASVRKCEDDTESGREDHMDDNIACLEPVPSSGYVI